MNCYLPPFVFQVSQALAGGRLIRKMAIRIFRDLLIKHEVDDRYSEKVCHMAAMFIALKPIYAGNFRYNFLRTYRRM